MTIQTARSFLFVPASRPERIAKALGSKADCVIVDLEDAVAPADKIRAREQMIEAFQPFDPFQLGRIIVRINPAASDWYAGDLQVLADWVAVRPLGGVMVPKASSRTALEAITAALGSEIALVPLVESLEGVDALDAIASAPQVVRLAFGNLDFQLDLGMKCCPEETGLGFARFQVTAACRRAGLVAPVDGVTVEILDPERLQRDAMRARSYGFGAKLCIHPDQVYCVNRAFTPSSSEVEWARRVLLAAQQGGGQVLSVDGKMVDAPVMRQAEKVLAAAKSFGSCGAVTNAPPQM